LQCETAGQFEKLGHDPEQFAVLAADRTALVRVIADIVRGHFHLLT
jgi:hypothetical protein